MSDERIRRMMHTAVDECLSGVENMPSQRQAVLRRLDETPRARRKTAFVPVMAALLMLAIAGATAAGLGLFGQLRAGKVDETSYERLAHLEEAAVSIGETVQLRGMGELTIDQAYCDGRSIY